MVGFGSATRPCAARTRLVIKKTREKFQYLGKKSGNQESSVSQKQRERELISLLVCDCYVKNNFMLSVKNDRNNGKNGQH